MTITLLYHLQGVWHVWDNAKDKTAKQGWQPRLSSVQVGGHVWHRTVTRAKGQETKTDKKMPVTSTNTRRHCCKTTREQGNLDAIGAARRGVAADLTRCLQCVQA
jgi:hypothetical protein